MSSLIVHVLMSPQASGRSRWLIAFRGLVLVLVALVVLLGNQVLKVGLPVKAIWMTLAAILLYNGIFWLFTEQLARKGAAEEAFIKLFRIQLLADVLALTALLHFSGGLENPFSVYYLLLIAIGTILMPKKDSYLLATIVSIAWAGLLLCEALDLLPHYNLQGFRLPVRYKEWSHIISEIFVLTSAAYVISYLSSALMERLRENERELYEANQACELRASELAALNQRLQELDRARTMFMRLVTHELRAPVAAIQSYLRLILDGYVPPERLEEIISKAEQRANDQLELIGDLLDLARLQDLSADQPVTPCDAAAVLRDVLDMFQARIDEKRLATHVQIQENLPLARVESEHVKQIWINLISNAVKYTPEGGEIFISLDLKDGMLCGTVRDTGIGIAPEEQERIFEQFFRSERAKSMSRQGTGLGLSIVKGIIERYGGKITLSSEVNKGSTFTFTLPIVSSE